MIGASTISQPEAQLHAGGVSGGARRGFTLIELLVVIAVIGILTAMSVPAIKTLSSSNDRAQAENMVRAKLAEAHALAIQRNTQVGLVFFEEGGKDGSGNFYSMPVHGGQTAMQLIIADYDQTQYNPLPANTVFVPYSTARTYLPAGIGVAALNDDPSRGVMTGDEQSSTLGATRVILFGGDGSMITRHGLARPDLGSGGPGAYPRAQGDWKFITKRDTHANVGVSSPGIFLYTKEEYAAAAIPTDHSGDAAREKWVKSHATAIVVNANIGTLMQ